jgi:F420-dependent oxidoreductase-like protein
MKFGIQTGPQAVDWTDLRAVWDDAERYGLDSAWVFDHLVPLLIGDDQPVLEGWTLLAALAERTERLTIGCLVSSNTFRHPAVLAKMAATVDIMSEGRLVLGLGAGYHEIEHTAYGLAFSTQRGRAEMLDEACQVVKALFQGGPVSFDGEHYTLNEAPFAPLPVQEGGPPLMVGGRGEKLTFPIIARHADQWNLAGGAAAADFEQKWGVLKDCCADVGRDPDEIETNMGILTFVDRSAARAEERARQCAKHFGLDEELAPAIFIAGDPAGVEDTIRGLEEVGVKHYVMTIVHGINYDDVELFANEVASKWR